MLNPLQMEAFIQSIAARADLRVTWERNSNQPPRTDGNTVFLPAITDKMSLEDYSLLKHYVVHEVDHVLHSDFKIFDKYPTAAENLLGLVINCLEDIRIEKKGAAEYLGDAMNSNAVQGKRALEIAKSMKSVSTQPEHPKHEMFTNASPLIAWSNEHWSDIYPSVAAATTVTDENAKLFPKAEDRLNKLRTGNYGEEFTKCKNSWDVCKLSERIVNEVYEEDAEKMKEQAQQNRKQQGQNKEEEGEGQEGQEGQGEGEGEGKEGKQGKKGEHGKGKKRREQEATVDYSELAMDPHDTPGPSRTALHIHYKDSNFHRANYTPCTQADYLVRRPLKDCPMLDGSTFSRSMRETLRQTNPNFAHRVRTILQVRAKARTQYGQKSGRLNQSSLHRLFADDKHYAERIFKRKETTDVLDSAVFLLVDQSGSMGGSKFVHAAVSACVMSEVLGNVLHIPVFIASFTDSGPSPTGNGQRQNIFIHREWKDKLLSNDKLIQSFAKGADVAMGNNADGDAIMWAAHEIAKQKQKRKLIIVFSDGQPAGGYRGDVPGYTKKVVQMLEKETPINIVGIGIMDENVRHLYKEHQVIYHLDELEKALLSTIEKKLK